MDREVVEAGGSNLAAKTSGEDKDMGYESAYNSWKGPTYARHAVASRDYPLVPRVNSTQRWLELLRMMVSLERALAALERGITAALD